MVPQRPSAHRAGRPSFGGQPEGNAWVLQLLLVFAAGIALVVFVLVPWWQAPEAPEPEAGSQLPVLDQLRDGGDVSFRGLRPGVSLETARAAFGSPLEPDGDLVRGIASLGDETWKVVGTVEHRDGVDWLAEVAGWRETSDRTAARWLLQSVVEAVRQAPDVHRVARGREKVNARALVDTSPGQAIPPVIHGAPLDEYLAWAGTDGRALVAGRTGTEVVIIETSRWGGGSTGK